MTTATQIIDRAAELIGYKDPDESLSGGESASFLSVLNDMLDSWNTQRLFIVAIQNVSTSISSSPVTIGSGGTVNITRPIELENGSYITYSGNDYGIDWIDREEYNALSQKTITDTVPRWGYYDAAVPLASLYLYPVPSTSVTLHLQVQTQLTEFADLSTSYDLAPGYRKALSYSLAEELAPGRRPLDPQIQRIAASARRAIKRTNVRVPMLDVTTYQRANIITGP